jgi:hypothetical protein
MQGRAQWLSKTNRFSSLRLALIVLAGIAVLAILAVSHRGYEPFVMAARPGLDGPEI